MWHKLRSGGHLIGWLLSGNLIAVGKAFARGPVAGGRELARAVSRISAGAWAVLRLRGRYRVDGLVNLCLATGVDRRALGQGPEAAFALAEGLNHHQQHEEALAILAPHFQGGSPLAKLHGVRGMAYLGLGRYAEARLDLQACATACPAVARDFRYYLYLAYLDGMQGDIAASRRAMAAQKLGPGHDDEPAPALARFLEEKVGPYLAPLKLRGTTGVIIGAFHTTVGHAILDPFHYIQLHRHRFDNLILIHPPYDKYSPATRLSATILDPYVDQIETTDVDTLDFAWQTLGELRHENLTFLIHHYWSLNREAYHARSDPRHPMSRGRHYLAPPVKMTAPAARICQGMGLDLSMPIVVVHVREHGYHSLQGQQYRNSDVRSYIPALRRLVALGYLVIRIGDTRMTSIRDNVPELIELPFQEGYDPILDPFLIARCEFMISCQSGPCSYARAFGKPNLVINAVYHYTLLPERNELIAFKSYRNSRTGEVMSADAVFRAGAHLFDRTDHFKDAGIVVEDMTPEEILAATNEMLAWLDDPEQPETEAQARFRARMNWFADHPNPAHAMCSPATDYIGYTLPECRISDAVCELRPGYLDVVLESNEELVNVS